MSGWNVKMMLTGNTCEFHTNIPLYFISGTIIPRSRWEFFPLNIPYAQTSSVHAQRLHSKAGRRCKWHVLHPPRNCKFMDYSHNWHILRKECVNITIPSIDHHVNELWLFPIFLDCVGYQQLLCFKLMAINRVYMYLNLTNVSRWNIKQEICINYFCD